MLYCRICYNCKYTCTNTYIHTYIYIYIYMHTHTYIYIYIYIYHQAKNLEYVVRVVRIARIIKMVVTPPFILVATFKFKQHKKLKHA